MIEKFANLLRRIANGIAPRPPYEVFFSEKVHEPYSCFIEVEIAGRGNGDGTWEHRNDLWILSLPR